jgi:Holliday junction DNA helicase RuvA
MYAYIQGKLVEKNPAYAVIEANGVGYMLHITLNTYSRIAENELCRLYTHQVIREDAHLLYGFADTEERDLFRMLISVSGIGPNTARMLLSSLSVNELKAAITTGQVGTLKSIKGIGEKSAQRIIVDLKDRLEKVELLPEKSDIRHNRFRDEALSGLVVLGFQKRNAEKALDQAIKDYEKIGPDNQVPMTVEFLIKEALKVL